MIQRKMMIFASAPCRSTRFRHHREREIITFLHSITITDGERVYQYLHPPRSRLMLVEDAASATATAAAATSRGAPTQQKIIINSNN